MAHAAQEVSRGTHPFFSTQTHTLAKISSHTRIMKRLRHAFAPQLKLSNYTNGRMAVVIVGIYLAIVLATYLRDFCSCMIPPVTLVECSMPLFMATIVTAPTTPLVLAALGSIGEPGLAGMFAATIAGATVNSLALWVLLRGRARTVRTSADLAVEE